MGLSSLHFGRGLVNLRAPIARCAQQREHPPDASRTGGIHPTSLGSSEIGTHPTLREYVNALDACARLGFPVTLNSYFLVI